MKPIHHLALYAWALFQNLVSTGRKEEFGNAFIRGCAWTVLLDAGKWLGVPTEASHFEMSPDRTSCGAVWVPSPQLLRSLVYPKGEIQYRLPNMTDSTAVGKNINLDEFMTCNLGHPFLREMGMHLVHDKIMYSVINSRLLECTGAFRDSYVPLNGTMLEMKRKTVDKYMSLFDKISAFYLLGKIYESTRILIDNKWLRNYVLTSLEMNFSPTLAEKLWSKIEWNEVDDRRILTKGIGFLPTKKELQTLSPLCEESVLCGVLDELFAKALIGTCKASAGIF